MPPQGGQPQGGGPQGAPPPPYGAPSGGQPGYGQQPGYGGGYGGPPQQYGGPPRGVVPPSLDEVYYKTGINILLFIITCGIWGAVWSYRTHDDLQKYNGDGLGGVVGLILGLLVSIAIPFTVSSEVEKMYQREGWQSPIRTIDGLWILLPLVGPFIWYPKAQNALNGFWAAKGSRPAAA